MIRVNGGFIMANREVVVGALQKQKRSFFVRSLFGKP